MRSRRHHDPPSTRLRDAILSLQPTAYWPLDDGVAPLRDIAGNKNATLVSGALNYGIGAPAPIGRGIACLGAQRTTATSVPGATTAVSVAVMFRTTDATASDRALVSRVSTAWVINIAATHRPYFQLRTAASGDHGTALAPSGAYNDGRWHLVIGTYDAVTGRLYIDGPQVASNALTSTWGAGSESIGIGSTATGGAPFTGNLAHAAYWANRALTGADARYLASIAFGG